MCHCRPEVRTPCCGRNCCKKPGGCGFCEGYGRLSNAGTKNERPWDAREKYMLYTRGFRDGAGVHAMRPDHKDLPAYERGYEEGLKARRDAVSAFCKEIGYTPEILRTADDVGES